MLVAEGALVQGRNPVEVFTAARRQEVGRIVRPAHLREAVPGQWARVSCPAARLGTE